MEYLRLTNKAKTVTYIVVDQDRYSNRHWPYAIKRKVKGSKTFEDVTSTDTLARAIQKIVSEITCDPRLGFATEENWASALERITQWKTQ